MIENRMIESWDDDAISLLDPQPIVDLYEFDLTLWKLVSLASSEEPGHTARLFGLHPSTVSLLAEADPDRLDRLASGSILSFSLQATSDEINSQIQQSYYPAVLISHEPDRFSIQFWSLVRELALKDPLVASQQFAIPRPLAKKIAKMTSSQICHLASRLTATFTFRFSEKLIVDLLTCAEDELRYYLSLKLQQSVSAVYVCDQRAVG